MLLDQRKSLLHFFTNFHFIKLKIKPIESNKKLEKDYVVIRRPYHNIRGWIEQRQVSKLMHRRNEISIVQEIVSNKNKGKSYNMTYGNNVGNIVTYPQKNCQAHYSYIYVNCPELFSRAKTFSRIHYLEMFVSVSSYI